MLDLIPFVALLFLGNWIVQRTGWAWGAVAVWLNLLWFIYQNEFGSGWMMYLRGVGLALVLAIEQRQLGLAWALLPWPLLLYTRVDIAQLYPYFPAWGEGLMLGVLVYLLTGFFKRPA